MGIVAATIVVGVLRERRVPDPSKLPDELTPDPKPGDVLLFYRPRRGRDYIIRILTRSPFYHVALYAGEGMVVEARPAGVGHNSLAGREDGFLVVPGLDHRGGDALAWAKTQIGDAFDRKDFFVIFLEHLFVGWHINYAPPNRYTCAEFATAAFRNAGVDPFPGRENSEIDPKDWKMYMPYPL